MGYPIYYPIENDTLPHLFDSFDGGTGASITMSGLATSDIKIYKDGGTTQRASVSGFALLDTDGIDFDSITGIHGFSIDLSDDDDAGFFEVGPWYHVVIDSITIDGQTVSFVAFAFRIVSATRGMAGTALPAAAADAAGGLPISDSGGLDLDTKLANTNEVTAARMGALTDWIDGGRLDLLLDAIKAVTDNLPNSGALTDLATAAALTTVDTVVDGIQTDLSNGTDGLGALKALIDAMQGNVTDILTDTGTTLPATLATIAGYIDTEIASILEDTGTTIPGLIAALNNISAADVKTAIEAAGSDLDLLVTALVNKAIWTEADGALEMFDDANSSLGSIAAQVATDGTYTTRKRAVV